MNPFRALAHGLRALLNPRRADAAVDDELHDYLERATAANRARGMSPNDAARAARLEVGNLTGARESVRGSGWEHALETTLQDVRYAMRRLRNAPVFTATAVVTLALGIGAGTAVFSVASPILLEPLPFANSARIVSVEDRTAQGVPLPPTLGTYDELRARARSFGVLAAADRWLPSITGSAEPERLTGQRITAAYFRVFGIAPSVGRAFTADEDRPGGPRVAIVSARLVARRYGGDRSIVGRTIDLDGDPYVVVGIMPRDFTDPAAPAAEIWEPMQERSTGNLDARAWGHHYRIVGRLAATATADAAMREIAQIAAAPMAAFPRPPWADLKGGLLVRRLRDVVAAPIAPSLFAIVGAVTLLLAIAVVNVTNLLLARAAQRRAEFAVRLALGAGGGRLVRQLVTESLMLALAGGALGLAIAATAVRAILASSGADLPRVDSMHVDARAFVFALGVTTLVGVLVGLVPALSAIRSEVADGARAGSRRTTGGHAGVRRALVVAEVATAMVLLVGAGLLLRSVRQLYAIEPGFEASHVVTMQVVQAGRAFPNDSGRLQFFQQALAAVRRVPGVTSAAFSSGLPMGGVDGYGYEIEAAAGQTHGAAGNAVRFAVTPDYFATMGIRLVRGRVLGDADRPGAPEAVLINESMARRWFGSGDPIGRRVRFGGEMSGDRWDYVVGVVGDVKAYGLAAPAPDAFYVADGQWLWVDAQQTLVVRASGDAAALVPAIKRAVWSVSRDAPIVDVAPMESYVNASAGPRRFALLVIEIFAAAALLLAAVGLYGVISGSVSERIREIGIRAALGASPGQVVGGVVTSAMALVLVGAGLGVTGAYAASRLLASMLFQVSRTDPMTYVGVLGLLVCVALLAAWAPARRAARVDPTTALRAE